METKITKRQEKNLDGFLLFLDLKRNGIRLPSSYSNHMLSSGESTALPKYLNKMAYGMFLVNGEDLTEEVPNLTHKTIIGISLERRTRNVINKTKMQKVRRGLASKSSESEEVSESKMSDNGLE